MGKEDKKSVVQKVARFIKPTLNFEIICRCGGCCTLTQWYELSWDQGWTREVGKPYLLTLVQDISQTSKHRPQVWGEFPNILPLIISDFLFSLLGCPCSLLRWGAWRILLCIRLSLSLLLSVGGVFFLSGRWGVERKKETYLTRNTIPEAAVISFSPSWARVALSCKR